MNNEIVDREIQGYNRKHRRIRGSDELKYPPKESRCRKGCGVLHYEYQTVKGKEYKEHPCFLAIGHAGECEFSSECAPILTGRVAA